MINGQTSKEFVNCARGNDRSSADWLACSSTAYGEWGTEELEGLVGFIPAGLESVSSTWTAPIPDYALPSLGESFLNLSLAYWLSAIIGVILSGGLLILIGKAITSRNSKNNGQL